MFNNSSFYKQGKLEKVTFNDSISRSKALAKIIKKSSSIDGNKLLANLDCKEEEGKFFYSEAALDREISKALKHGWYERKYYS